MCFGVLPSIIGFSPAFPRATVSRLSRWDFAMAVPCARCGSLAASTTAGPCDVCHQHFCRSLCREGHICGGDGLLLAVANQAQAAAQAVQGLGLARSSRLSQIDERREEIVREAKRLTAERKLEARKRQRMQQRVGRVPTEDLLAVIADRHAA